MGRLILPPGSIAYLDASPIIYSVEEHPVYWHPLQDVWTSLDSGEITVVTSELSLLETLVVPIRDHNTDLINAYDTLLTGFKVALIPIDISHLREAARLRALQNLKTPDAIHAATAILAGCTHLITNDPSFRRVEAIEVAVLSDLV